LRAWKIGCHSTNKEKAFVDLKEIDKQIDSEMDALERKWFAAHEAAEVARAELQTAESKESGSRALAGVLARLEKAEAEKHEIMRQICAVEDSLVED
jgi:hypothetical protein